MKINFSNKASLKIFNSLLKEGNELKNLFSLELHMIIIEEAKLKSLFYKEPNKENIKQEELARKKAEEKSDFINKQYDNWKLECLVFISYIFTSDTYYNKFSSKEFQSSHIQYDILPHDFNEQSKEAKAIIQSLEKKISLLENFCFQLESDSTEYCDPLIGSRHIELTYPDIIIKLISEISQTSKEAKKDIGFVKKFYNLDASDSIKSIHITNDIIYRLFKNKYLENADEDTINGMENIINTLLFTLWNNQVIETPKITKNDQKKLKQNFSFKTICTPIALSEKGNNKYERLKLLLNDYESYKAISDIEIQFSKMTLTTTLKILHSFFIGTLNASDQKYIEYQQKADGKYDIKYDEIYIEWLHYLLNNNYNINIEKNVLSDLLYKLWNAKFIHIPFLEEEKNKVIANTFINKESFNGFDTWITISKEGLQYLENNQGNKDEIEKQPKNQYGTKKDIIRALKRINTMGFNTHNYSNEALLLVKDLIIQHDKKANDFKSSLLPFFFMHSQEKESSFVIYIKKLLYNGFIEAIKVSTYKPEGGIERTLTKEIVHSTSSIKANYIKNSEYELIPYNELNSIEEYREYGFMYKKTKLIQFINQALEHWKNNGIQEHHDKNYLKYELQINMVLEYLQKLSDKYGQQNIKVNLSLFKNDEIHPLQCLYDLEFKKFLTIKEIKIGDQNRNSENMMDRIVFIVDIQNNDINSEEEKKENPKENILNTQDVELIVKQKIQAEKACFEPLENNGKYSLNWNGNTKLISPRTYKYLFQLVKVKNITNTSSYRDNSLTDLHNKFKIDRKKLTSIFKLKDKKHYFHEEIAFKIEF
jgi:hypothetical protein